MKELVIILVCTSFLFFPILLPHFQYPSERFLGISMRSWVMIFLSPTRFYSFLSLPCIISHPQQTSGITLSGLFFVDFNMILRDDLSLDHSVSAFLRFS